MTHGNYQQVPRPPLAEIDFATIAEGFNLIWRNVGFFVLAVLFQSIISFGISQIGSLLTLPLVGPTPTPDPSDMTPIWTHAIKQSLYSVPFSILGAIIVAPFVYAICHMALKLIRGESLDFNDVFVGFQRIGEVLFLMVMIQISMWIGSIFCIVPMYIVGGLTMFSMPILASSDLKPVDAFKKSIELLKPHWLMATLYFFVVSLCSILGILACCVGILVTASMLYVCTTLVYRDFTMGRGMVSQPPTETLITPENHE